MKHKEMRISELFSRCSNQPHRHNVYYPYSNTFMFRYSKHIYTLLPLRRPPPLRLPLSAHIPNSRHSRRRIIRRRRRCPGRALVSPISQMSSSQPKQCIPKAVLITGVNLHSEGTKLAVQTKPGHLGGDCEPMKAERKAEPRAAKGLRPKKEPAGCPMVPT